MHGAAGRTTYYGTKEIQQRIVKQVEPETGCGETADQAISAIPGIVGVALARGEKDCDKRTDNVVVRRIEGWRPLRNRLSE